MIERGMLTQVEHPEAGQVSMLRSPMRLSDTPIREPDPAPLLGEHTNAVLTEVLGYDDETIAAMFATR